MSNRITVVGELNSFTGYGQHCLQIIQSLREAGCFVSIRPIRVSETEKCKVPAEVKQLIVNGVQPEEWEVLVSPPTMAPTPGKKTVYVTTWESTRLSQVAVENLNKAELVIVPCYWNATVLNACGVDRPIAVVPLAVDLDVFHYTSPHERDGLVCFGVAGSSASGPNRKGLQRCVDIFRKAFPNDNNVRLHVKCLNKSEVNTHGDNRIVVRAEFLTEKELAVWYADLDCFINMGTGAFELMALQAMACGRPVIAAPYGGITEYFEPFVGYDAEFELVPAKDAWTGHGLWAEILEDDLKFQMYQAISHSGQRKNLGLHAASKAALFRWDNFRAYFAYVLDKNNVLSKPKANEPSVNRPIFVQLGRYGDLLNMLPMLRKSYQDTGEKPWLLVHKKFADLTEGITYAEPIVYDPPNGEDQNDIKAAIAYASRWSNNVKVSQVSGYEYYPDQKCQSFTEESYRLAGIMDALGEPLVFDNRDMARETALADIYLTDFKPQILVHLSGISSPFQYYQEVLATLHEAACNIDAMVVDISHVQADKIYDLLGLMDRCQLLVCADSSLLHLANASNIPVIALVTDKPTLWHGTKPRCNTLMTVRYDQVPSRLPAIKALVEATTAKRRFIHVYSDFCGKGDSLRRHRLARQTWTRQYRTHHWVSSPVPDHALPRLFNDSCRKVPFVKDLIDYAISQAEKNDELIVLTNTDTCFDSRLTTQLLQAMQVTPCVYSFRRDFRQLTREMLPHEVDAAEAYPGSDFFAFTVGWWLKHRHEYPDLLLGTEAWDWCLRELMLINGHGFSLGNVIYHERHESLWEVKRHELPSQQYNHELARPFLEKLGVYHGEFSR